MPYVHCPSCGLSLSLTRGSVGGACPRCLSRRGDVVLLADAGERPADIVAPRPAVPQQMRNDGLGGAGRGI